MYLGPVDSLCRSTGSFVTSPRWQRTGFQLVESNVAVRPRNVQYSCVYPIEFNFRKSNSQYRDQKLGRQETGHVTRLTVARRAHRRRVQRFLVKAGNVERHVIAASDQRHVLAAMAFAEFIRLGILVIVVVVGHQ